MSDFDTSELVALAADLNHVGGKALAQIRPVFQEGASDLKDAWRSNARETSGRHGHLYPNSITYETTVHADGITAEIGPDSDKPQGGMGPGFEFGSVNQPAHLDGQRAADDLIPRIERRVGIAAEGVFDA